MTVRPSGTRLVKFRDVPTGTVACGRDGFWGVVVRGNGDSSHYGCGLDRWNAPAVSYKSDDLLHVPWSKRLP